MKDDDLKRSAMRVHEFLRDHASESIQEDAQAVFGELFRARAALDQLVTLENIHADYFSMLPRDFWAKHAGVAVPFDPQDIFRKMCALVEKYRAENSLVTRTFPPAPGEPCLALRKLIDFAAANPPQEIRAGLVAATRLPYAKISGRAESVILLGMPVVIDESLPPSEIILIFKDGESAFTFKFDLGGA